MRLLLLTVKMQTLLISNKVHKTKSAGTSTSSVRRFLIISYKFYFLGTFLSVKLAFALL